MPENRPLTDDEIRDLLPIRQDGWSDEDYGLWLARAVERAHGIGVDRINYFVSNQNEDEKKCTCFTWPGGPDYCHVHAA